MEGLKDLRAPRKLTVRKKLPEAGMEHNLCSCGKSQVQPGDGSTIVVGTVDSLWLRLTVLPASKLPRSRKDKLGHEELSSLHTFGSSVSAKTDLAAATAFLFYGSLLL